MSWKCPNCEEEIETLDYDVGITATEYGTAYLNEEKSTEENTRDIVVDWDSNDMGNTDSNGDYEYRCPECQEEINPDRLIWIEEEEEEEKKEIKKPEELEETKHNIIRPKTPIIIECNINNNNSSMICKECSHIIIYDDMNYSDEFPECPKCGTVNSIQEFRKKLSETI